MAKYELGKNFFRAMAATCACVSVYFAHDGYQQIQSCANKRPVNVGKECWSEANNLSTDFLIGIRGISMAVFLGFVNRLEVETREGRVKSLQVF